MNFQSSLTVKILLKVIIFTDFYLFCFILKLSVNLSQAERCKNFSVAFPRRKEKNILAVFFRIALFNFNRIERVLIHLFTIVGSTAQSAVRNSSSNQCFLSVYQQKLSERKNEKLLSVLSPFNHLLYFSLSLKTATPLSSVKRGNLIRPLKLIVKNETEKKLGKLE